MNDDFNIFVWWLLVLIVYVLVCVRLWFWGLFLGWIVIRVGILKLCLYFLWILELGYFGVIMIIVKFLWICMFFLMILKLCEYVSVVFCFIKGMIVVIIEVCCLFGVRFSIIFVVGISFLYVLIVKLFLVVFKNDWWCLVIVDLCNV